MNVNVDICRTCGESKTVDGARFEHVRLGLDEAPEPVVCRCKEPAEVEYGIRTRIMDASRVINIDTTKNMTQIGHQDINAVRVTSVDANASLEVELRMNPVMSESMFVLMKSGMFGPIVSKEIEEVGCSWWIGAPINKNSKVRMRSNKEKVIKIPMQVYQVAPGMKLAISDEYTFTGTILRPDYYVQMEEMSTCMMIVGVSVTLIARKYTVEETSSYAAEVELGSGITHMDLRMVMSWVVNAIGSTRMMANEVDNEYMSSVRSTDHAVVDVSDMNTRKGTFMHKVDGMKVYIFCYTFGYVITMTDRNLTVISCSFTEANQPLLEMTRTPDVMIAEMMMDGSLVYIDTLARDEEILPSSRQYSKRPDSLYQYPVMIYRDSWDTMTETKRGSYSTLPRDGVVCVTTFRTLRLKEPTVDLRYIDGYLHSIDNSNLVPIAKGCRDMNNRMIYEMKVSRGSDQNEVVLTNPVARVSKVAPNNMDIVRRAFASVSKNINMATSLFDITAMSFSMRSRVYEMAQASASTTRKVIVIFGCGRLQEWRLMRPSNFSYIAIDPEIDVTRFSSNMNRVRVLPYDMNASFATNVISISKSAGNVLYCKCRSEDFMMRTSAIQFMSANNIPAVFSFSISYHIKLINTLTSSDIPCFGCGFAHDGMSSDTVGAAPVTMKRRKARQGYEEEVIASFGKSVYVEPFLSLRSVRGLRLMKEVLKDVWMNVDLNTIDIMRRAVIMCGS